MRQSNSFLPNKKDSKAVSNDYTIKQESVKLDSSLRLLFQGSNKFKIGLVNGIFGTHLNYSCDVVELNKDFSDSNLGKREADILVEVTMYQKEKHLYHIEFQVKTDETMSLRMFEYGSKVALQKSFENKTFNSITFPKQCVMFFTKKGEAPSKLDLDVIFSSEDCEGDNVIKYKIPCISYFDLSDEEIIKRFKPFIVFKLYGLKHKYNGKNRNVIKEDFLVKFNDIKNILINSYEDEELSSVDYGHCVDILNSLSDYANNKFKLEVDIKKELTGMKSIVEEWKKEFREEGMKEGMKEGERKARVSTIIKLYKKGMTVEDILYYTEESESFVKSCIEAYNNKINK